MGSEREKSVKDTIGIEYMNPLWLPSIPMSVSCSKNNWFDTVQNIDY